MAPGLESFGRLLIFIGALLLVIGGGMLLLGRVPGLGRLPGDIHLQGRNWSCWIPLGTSILLSLLLTLVLNLIARLFR